MRIIVHRDRCQGHARCWAMAPEICELDDEGYKTPGDITVAPEAEKAAWRGAKSRPGAGVGNRKVNQWLRKGVRLAIAAVLVLPSAGHAASRPDQAAFRAIFRELVETDTSAPDGDCTLAAQRMLSHLRAAGFDANEAEVFVPEGKPRDGGLVARIEGADRRLAPMLLVDHIDVVAARRADWPRDPFVLVEEDGYFIGRGVIDDKALSAIWIDSFVRLKREGFRPRRTMKLALTCGEEGGGRVNGVEWLLTHRRDAVQSGFALNEGGYGIADAAGNPVALYLAVGEKQPQNFTIEARNPGGHSSRPRAENALYDLAGALLAIRDVEFPVQISPTTRGYFVRMAPIVGGKMGAAMRAVAEGAGDGAALATVTSDPIYNAMLRSTCVATTAEAGHAVNALPQRARAVIQCRLLPGDSAQAIEERLAAALDGKGVTLTRAVYSGGAVAVAPPLDPAILAPAEVAAQRFFPGIPVVPNLLTASTDGRLLSAAGIPTYGVPGIVLDADGNGAHGVNERIRVRSVMEGRDYLYALIRLYAGGR
jgi:acetylornithine deacetylase/succinyl-diaminopimelate desuccinylase-like protein/ferredoxin